jgi:hypothetical protein
MPYPPAGRLVDTYIIFSSACSDALLYASISRAAMSAPVSTDKKASSKQKSGGCPLFSKRFSSILCLLYHILNIKTTLTQDYKIYQILLA